MLTLDEKILKRLQMSPPVNCTVVPNSTPIIAFGRFRTASVATISLNPSYKEFEPVYGNLRFHTLDSLGIKDYSEVNEGHRDKIIDYCETYFERSVVYKDWFDKISQFIKASSGYDYYNGTACHLDLSQWATKVIWGKLDEPQREALLRTGDIEILIEIIKNGNFHTLFLNGITTTTEFFKYIGVNYRKIVLRKRNNNGKKKVEGYIAVTNKVCGKDINRTIRIIGWNLYVKYEQENDLSLISEWINKEMERCLNRCGEPYHK